MYNYKGDVHIAIQVKHDNKYTSQVLRVVTFVALVS